MSLAPSSGTSSSVNPTTSTSNSTNSDAPGPIFEIPCLSVIETYNILNNISIPKLIIDLREKDKYEAFRLRNAISLPIKSLWNKYVEQNAEMNKYGLWEHSDTSQRQMSIEEKEVFWRFVQEDPFRIMLKKSFDEFEYRGTVYKRGVLYADCNDDLKRFMHLFRHDVSTLSPKEIEGLHATDFVSMPRESLSTGKDSSEYKTFSTTTDLIYMKKNFKLKQLMTFPLHKFQEKYPFLFTTLKTKALEGEMPAMVNDFLFIGGYNHACNREHLQALRIDCILNMAVELDNKFEGVEFEDLTKNGRKWTITYKKLGIDDTVKDSVMQVMEEALEFIDKAQNNNDRVLVHCAMGISRASSIVIAWLMRHNRWTFEKAKRHVKDCRSCIKPNPAFTKQLEGEFQDRILKQ